MAVPRLCNFLFRKGGLEQEQAKSDTKRGRLEVEKAKRDAKRGQYSPFYSYGSSQWRILLSFFMNGILTEYEQGSYMHILDSTGRKLQFGLFVGVHTNKIYFHYYERNTKTLSTYPYYVVRVSKFRVYKYHGNFSLYF